MVKKASICWTRAHFAPGELLFRLKKAEIYCPRRLSLAITYSMGRPRIGFINLAPPRLIFELSVINNASQGIRGRVYWYIFMFMLKDNLFKYSIPCVFFAPVSTFHGTYQ